MPPLFRLDSSHLLGAIALAPTALGIFLIVLVTSAHAAPADAGDTVRVTIHRHAGEGLTGPLRARIERAALAVCGGEGSLAEVTRAVRASPCWRNAVAGALAQVEPRRDARAMQP
jgi:UrcA family protein